MLMRLSKRLFTGSVCILFHAILLSAQTYTSSGSTGSDGPLSFPNAKPGDTVIFNPASYNPVLDSAGDGVFNFTTITIPAGVTIKLSGQVLPGSVYWLATGAVDIEGALDLSGGAGHPAGASIAVRIPSIPGSGGYPGGVGGNGIYAESPGLGPNGGNAGGCGGSGGIGANSLLVPLFGGSGGGGSEPGGTGFGGGGGAGGGAILIASSTSITVNGTVLANGGDGWAAGSGDHGGGGGGGGAIRLVAQTIAGSGLIQAAAGGSGCGFIVPVPGIIRLEAYNITFSHVTVSSSNGAITLGTPFATFTPTSGNRVPSVKVVSVGGVPVNPNPTGSFQTPDATISSSAAVPIVVQGINVTLGTVVHLQIYSDNGPDILVDTPALAGTLASSTATVNVTFPPGYSRGFINASFTTTTN